MLGGLFRFGRAGGAACSVSECTAGSSAHKALAAHTREGAGGVCGKWRFGEEGRRERSKAASLYRRPAACDSAGVFQTVSSASSGHQLLYLPADCVAYGGVSRRAGGGGREGLSFLSLLFPKDHDGTTYLAVCADYTGAGRKEVQIPGGKCGRRNPDVCLWAGEKGGSGGHLRECRHLGLFFSFYGNFRRSDSGDVRLYVSDLF